MKVKNAHMVSKSYLRAWADERGTVDVIDLEHQRGHVSSLGDATVVSYAYEPAVLTHDLEREYARIEDRGIPALKKLRLGESTSTKDRAAAIAFLDMHLDRGRYANQTKILTPAVLVTDGNMKDADFNMADRMLLSQSFTGVTRLKNAGLEDWPWRVFDLDHLATGDGAVLLWRESDNPELSTVTFPLSPTRLLLIGQVLTDPVRLNALVAMKSQRWLVGQRGSLDLEGMNLRQRR